MYKHTCTQKLWNVSQKWKYINKECAWGDQLRKLLGRLVDQSNKRIHLLGVLI